MLNIAQVTRGEKIVGSKCSTSSEIRRLIDDLEISNLRGSNLLNQIKRALLDIDFNEVTEATEFFRLCLEHARLVNPGRVVQITPARAVALLLINNANRKLSISNIHKIASDLSSGSFEWNGETLIVSDDFHMNDGQHRCLAVIFSGVSLTTSMTFGVTRSSRTTVGIGYKRTTGNLIAMMDGKNPEAGAAIAKMLILYEGKKPLSAARDQCPTEKEQIDKYWECHDEIQSAISRVPKRSIKIGSPSFVGFLIVILSRVNKDDATLFIENVAEPKGEWANDASPMLQLNRRLDTQRTKYTINQRLELIIRHWNAWIVGRKRRNKFFKTPPDMSGNGTIPAIEKMS